MAYKLLGMVVFHGAKWFIRRRYGRYIPSRRVAAAGLVGASVAVLALAGRRGLSGD